jgi:hypothetical protein
MSPLITKDINTFTAHSHNSSIIFGEPQLVTTGVSSPVFSSSGNSILAQYGSYPMGVSEITIEAGSNFGSTSNLATSLYSTEIAISPNKAYVAFVEFQKVYLYLFLLILFLFFLLCFYFIIYLINFYLY